MKVYKVWVHIEEIDEEEDHYEDVCEPQCLGTYETFDEAVDKVASLEQE